MRKLYLALTLLAALILSYSTPTWMQEPRDPKQAQKLDHTPKVDSVLEQIIKLAAQGNSPAAAQAAAQARVPLRGNQLVAVIQLGEQFADPSGEEYTALMRLISVVGGQVISTSKYALKILLPLDIEAVRRIAGLGSVSFVRPPLTPQTLVTSEGVSLTGASGYHANGFRGQGVKIAVIDLGFAGLSSAQARGELPGGLQTFDFTGTGVDSGTNHGTAVAEIVYDMAPQAQLLLMKIADEVDLENAKEEAIRQGAKIINHSVGWFNTNFYDGTGIINNIVADARNRGILWVNAAGNYGRRHWQGSFKDSNGDRWHEFSGSDDCLRITANAGEAISVFLTWNDWPASRNDYDLYLFDSTGRQVAQSERIQSGTQTPTENFFFQTFMPGTFCIKIKADGTPAPRTFSLFSVNHDVNYPVPASSILAPGDSPNALTVGAVNHQNWTTGPLAAYSSQGPTNAGLSKPDLVGPDRVSTSTYTEFFGTSAASPHVAGAAALLLSQNPSLSAAQLESRLKSEAIPMGSPLQFGSGRLNLAQAGPPRLPDLIVTGLTANPTNPRVGDSVTISGVVRNQGTGDAGAFVVELRDSGGTERRTINSLVAGASAGFSFTRRVNQLNETFVVVADALNQVNESNENNNTAELRVTASQPTLKPDLTISTVDWSPRTPRVGETVTYTVIVRNQGQANAGAFVTELRDSAGTAQQPSSGLAAGASITVSFSRRVNNITETVTFVVDALNQVDESNEANNTAQIRVDAQPEAPRKPDLTIAGTDWSPRTPRLGDSVNFTVVVRNQGTASAGAFFVEIRDSRGADRRSVAALDINSSISLNFERRLNTATEIFTIVVDPDNRIDELNEANNSTQIRIDAMPESRLPDLLIDSLDYTPRELRVGDAFTTVAVIRNAGNADAGSFVVDLQDSAGTTRQSVTGLRAGASVRLDFPRRLNNPTETITVTVDALRQVAESNEANNTQQIVIRASTTPPPPPPTTLSLEIRTDKSSYQIRERLTITFTLGASAPAYVYIFDIDPAGRVSQIFPNALSRRNPLSPGTYTLPDGPYTLVINGPEGTEYLHAVAVTQAVELGLNGTQNSAWLNPEAFRAELTRRLQAAAPSAAWALAVASFQVGTTAPPQGRPPTACFTYTPASPSVGQPVTFDGSCSSDPDGQIVRYDWDLDGDGRVDTQGVRVTFFYSTPRAYSVTLRVTDNQNLSATQTQTVTVRPVANPPTEPSPTPTLPLGIGGFFIMGSDQLLITVQGALGWSGDRPYQITLETNGAILGATLQTQTNAAPQAIPALSTNQMQLTLAGTVRSNGRVTYALQLAPGVTAARFDLLLDINGDGVPERAPVNTIFIYLTGIGRSPGFFLPFSNPFIISNPQGMLLPFGSQTRLCVPAEASGFRTISCWPR